jgi:hypothetical protein
MGIVWVALIGVRRLRMPRWSLPVATGILAFGFLAIAEHFPLSMLFVSIFAISTLLLLVSMAVGRIAARSVSRRDSDVAMAIFAGYVIGQFMPFLY